MFGSIKSYNICLNAVFRHRHSLTIVLPLVCCAVDDTLFEISTEIRGLGMSTSLLLLWKPRSWF